jgi:hypothetical protein
MKIIGFLIISFLVISLQIGGDFLHQFSHYLEKNKETISWAGLGRFLQNPGDHGGLPIPDKDFCTISKILALVHSSSTPLKSFQCVIKPPAPLMGLVTYRPQNFFIAQFPFLSFDSRAPPFLG